MRAAVQPKFARFLDWSKALPGVSAASCRIDAAGLFEPARVAAPIAAARVAVPLAHAFPFFAIGEDGAAGVDGVLECWSDGGMNNRNDLVRAAFGTDWSLPLAWRFLCAFRRAFWNRNTLGRRHFKYPRSR